MADTRVLRQHILARLDAIAAEQQDLKERLQAIDLIEATEVELARRPSVPRPPIVPSPGRAEAANFTLIDTCRSLLNEEFHPTRWFIPAVQRLFPDTGEPAIFTAFRRLSNESEVETRGNGGRASPYEYRLRRKLDTDGEATG